MMATTVDLRKYFKHLHWRPMPHSLGVQVASDFADYPEDHPVFELYKRCGLQTQDEVDILFRCAEAMPLRWCDIGAHTGWTSAHIASALCYVDAVEPMLREPSGEFADRFAENIANCGLTEVVTPIALRSEEYFELLPADARFDGFMIDGDHNPPWPMNDAQNAFRHLADRGVILMHDAIGRPVQDAVIWLVQQGLNCKVYPTCHVVALCWRGDFMSPEYRADPRVKAAVMPHLGEIARFV